MIFVLDTNVLISATFATKGAVWELWDAWKHRRFTLAVSESILAEVSRALTYPEVQVRHRWSASHVAVFVSQTRYLARLYPATTPIDVPLPDEADGKFLSCAIEAEALAVVTGDDHLLRLKQYKGIPIVTPIECLTRFFAGRDEAA